MRKGAEPITQLVIVETKKELDKQITRSVGETYSSPEEVLGDLMIEMSKLQESISSMDLSSVKDRLINISTKAFAGAATINAKTTEIDSIPRADLIQ
jgi:hypothetical protein